MPVCPLIQIKEWDLLDFLIRSKYYIQKKSHVARLRRAMRLVKLSVKNKNELAVDSDPNLAPKYFHLFLKLKKAFKGKHFGTNDSHETVISYTGHALFSTGILNFVSFLTKSGLLLVKYTCLRVSYEECAHSNTTPFRIDIL